jgi:ankyrin repeat protein
MVNTIEQIAQNAQKQELRFKLEKQIKCHQVFKTSTYEEFKNINPDRVPGTCMWALNHPRYRQWQQSQENDVLWISADPGCGKSVLSKSLVDNELQDTETHTVCYFFFKDNEEQNTLCTALCALLHQLFAKKRQLIQHAMDSWEHSNDGLQRETHDLWRILIRAGTDPAANHITCVIDALDECRESDRSTFIRKLKDFYSGSFGAALRNSRLKFLVTSRPYDDIEVEFRGLLTSLPNFRLPGENENDTISAEIDKVIKAEVSHLSKELELLEEARFALEEKLLSMTHRTYLWLFLVIGEVRNSLDRNPKEITNVLNHLPTSVYDAYEKLLEKRTRNSENRRAAEILLHIVVGAKRSLTLKEMDVAFQIGTHTPRSSYEELALDGNNLVTKVRNLCGLFVFVKDSRVYLIHQTAKEFLIAKESIQRSGNDCWKHSLEDEKSQTVLAKICVQYLSFTNFGRSRASIKNRKRSQDRDSYDFMMYAAENWPAHFRDSQTCQNDALISQVLDLYDKQSQRFKTWFEIFDPDQKMLLMDELWLAAFNGHEAVVKRLLDRGGVCLNQTDRLRRQTPLALAAANGYEAVVRLLVNAGMVKMNLKDYRGRTPLWWAAARGDMSIVKLLLAKDEVLIDSKDSKGQTPLFKAAELGHKAIVQLILATGKMDLDLTTGKGRTTLSKAAEQGQATVVKLLLKAANIDVNLKDNQGRTALSWAAEMGHRAVVSLLLETVQVNVNLKDKSGRTPLLWAAKMGHAEVVELLLETDQVDVNLRDKSGSTPLSWAAKMGRAEVVELLLETDQVEVNLRDKSGRTPLLYATVNGHMPIVGLLIATDKVELDSSGDGRSPLSYAAGMGREMIVKQLLDTCKVKVNLEDRHGWTPLSWAVKNGEKSVVRLLLANDQVNVDSMDEKGQTPLSWAAKGGYEAVVKELLSQRGKIRIDSKDQNGRTPLSWTAEKGHEGVVKLLLATGKIDVESRDRFGRSPFFYAAWRGHMAVLKLLLATGKVDLNFKDGGRRTALSWAIYGGDVAAVTLIKQAQRRTVAEVKEVKEVKEEQDASVNGKDNGKDNGEDNEEEDGENREDNGEEDNGEEDNGEEDNGEEDNGEEDNGEEDNGEEDNGEKDNGEEDGDNEDNDCREWLRPLTVRSANV